MTRIIFLFLSASCAVVGIVLNVSTYLFGYNSYKYFHVCIALFLLAFPIFFNAVSQISKFRLGNVDKNGKIRFINILKELPVWVKMFCLLLLIFAGYHLNTNNFVTRWDGVPKIIDENYVIYNHGVIVKEITVKEYEVYQVDKMRGWSGMIFIFYSISFLILFIAMKCDEKYGKIDQNNTIT